MKKLLLAVGVLILTTMAVTANAAETMTYRLKQVSAVSGGKQYVFVQNDRAMVAQITDGALQTTDNYASNGLTGTEDYVWTLKWSYSYYFIKGNPDLSNLSQSSSTINNLSFVTSGGQTELWTFDFNDDGIATIKNKQNAAYYLGLTSSTATTYKAYSQTNHPCSITVYELVPETYTRTIEQAKLGNVGTICLPYQVNNPSGAEFYQMAYKETDGSGNPSQLYYEAVDGPLLAGHPYVFVSTATTIELNENPSVEHVASPVNSNGFYGTFKEIVDAETASDKNTLAGNYIVYNNQFQLCGLGCGLSPYRAYIKMSEVPQKDASAPAPTRRMLAIGEDVAPQIIEPDQGLSTDLTTPANCGVAHKVIRNGKIMIERDGQFYTLMGIQQN